MDQNHAAEQFPEGHGLLLTEGDAGMRYSLRMQPEKVIVVRHDNTSRGSGEFKMCQIGGADQAGVRGGSHVDVAPPKTGSHVG